MSKIRPRSSAAQSTLVKKPSTSATSQSSESSALGLLPALPTLLWPFQMSAKSSSFVGLHLTFSPNLRGLTSEAATDALANYLKFFDDMYPDIESSSYRHLARAVIRRARPGKNACYAYDVLLERPSGSAFWGVARAAWQMSPIASGRWNSVTQGELPMDWLTRQFKDMRHRHESVDSLEHGLWRFPQLPSVLQPS